MLLTQAEGLLSTDCSTEQEKRENPQVNLSDWRRAYSDGTLAHGVPLWCVEEYEVHEAASGSGGKLCAVIVTSQVHGSACLLCLCEDMTERWQTWPALKPLRLGPGHPVGCARALDGLCAMYEGTAAARMADSAQAAALLMYVTGECAACMWRIHQVRQQTLSLHAQCASWLSAQLKGARLSLDAPGHQGRHVEPGRHGCGTRPKKAGPPQVGAILMQPAHSDPWHHRQNHPSSHAVPAYRKVKAERAKRKPSGECMGSCSACWLEWPPASSAH